MARRTAGWMSGTAATADWRRLLARGRLVALLQFALPLALGTAMVGVAEAAGDRSLLFPEGAALAWGAWAMGRQDWRRLGPRLAMALALCAACGVAATILLPSALTAELTAVTAGVAVIAALRAPVGPALSAAVLPAVAGIRNWWYVLSVCVVAAVVLAGTLARGRLVRPAPKGPDPPSDPRSGGGACRLLITWTVSTAWLSVAAGLALPLAASAPPLLASAFEWVSSGRRGDAHPGSRLGVVLTVAWAAGAVAAWHVRPAAASAAIALVIAAIVMRVSRVMHPPAVAVALVPLVLGPPATWGGLLAGGCSVAAAVTVLYGSGSAGLRLAAGLRWPRHPLGRERMSPGATGLRHPIEATNRSQS